MKKILFIITILILSNCAFFETRSPDDPNIDNGTFVPPISPEIVIDNFIEALQRKNVDNYIACFTQNGYSFVPSIDAVAMFPSFFDMWQISDERRYLLALTTALGESNNLSIDLSNRNFETMNADSAVLITDYTIHIDLQETTFPKEYSGRASFTIVPTQNGLWGINRWLDFQFNNVDSVKETFSFLKAYFHN